MKRKPISSPKKLASKLNRRKLICEALEPRYLMAGDLGQTPLSAPENLSSGLGVDSTQAETKAPTHYYIADGRPVGMSIESNRIVVGFEGVAVSDPEALLPSEYQFIRTIEDGTFLYEAPGAGSASAVEQLKTIPGVEFTAPVFYVMQSQSEAVVLNEVIVAMEEGVDPVNYFSSDARFDSYRSLAGTSDQFVATIRDGYGEPALAISNQLSEQDGVAWAAPNFYQSWQKYFTPNDTRFTNQWHLNNTGQGGGLVDADSDLPEAWDVNQGGSSSLVVGIIDDGVSVHPDLNLWVNSGEIPSDNIDNDGNGWIDDVNGWNFVANNNLSINTTASDMHGTSVAGVAAAKGNNALGVAGASYNSKVSSARIFEGSSVASDANIAASIYYMGGRKASGTGTWKSADLVNNSWGGGGPSTAISTALIWGTTLGRQGVGATYLFATGNDYGTVSLPASLSASIPGVVAVGATNNKGTRSDYSNFGPEVDIVTPSNDLRSGYLAIDTTDRVGAAGYDPSDYTGTGANGFGGTSSATPLASGITALVMAQAESSSLVLSPPQIRSYLRNNTDLIGGVIYDPTTGKNLEFGYGRLNANSAIRGLGKAEISVLSNTEDLATSTGVVGFGNVVIGDSKTTAVRIRNQGTLPLNLTNLSIGAGPFSIMGTPAGTTLNLGESAVITIQFDPTVSGLVSRTVTIESNDTDEATFTFNISGTGLLPNIAGRLFEDGDGDGVRDIQDTPIASRVVFLDNNNNSTIDTLATQTFSRTTPTSLPDLATAISNLTVSGAVGEITDVNVRINVTHTWDSDLTFYLISPAGTRVLLFSAVGGSGDNFTNTVFDDGATTAIAAGTVPFTGTFRPQGSLAVLNGEVPNGDWKIESTDNGSGDFGTLLNWDVIISTGELSRVADSKGFYSFLGVPNGTHIVRSLPPAGWVGTGPSGGTYSVTIASPSDSFIGRDFGYGKADRFYGLVFSDTNQDGIFGATELGAPSRQLLVDSNGNGALDASTTNTLPNTTALTIADVSTVNSTITAGGFTNAITDINVQLNISHTWVADLDVFLVHPDGTRVELFTDVGDSGDNFTNTIFDDAAAVSIGNGTPPYVGTFRPEGSLAVLNGKNPNGIWRLELTDDEAGITGTLNNWSLAISTGESMVTTNGLGVATVDLVSGNYSVLLQSLSGWIHTVPATGIRTATVSGVPFFDQKFGTYSANLPPVIAANAAAVTGNEGTLITNAGTWSDTDSPGSSVILTASMGAIVKNANGTWTWSISGTDDLAATSVTITGTDGNSFATTSFTFAVNNVAPTLTRSLAVVNGNVFATLTNTGTYADVPADTVNLSASNGTIVKNPNGTWSWSITPTAAIVNETITVTAIDDDGGTSSVTFVLNASAAVVNAQVYHKGSFFAQNGSNIDAALDPGKVIARAGSSPQTLSFANVINSTRGINGVILDIAGLASIGLTLSDFSFRMSPQGLYDVGANPPNTWQLAPDPAIFASEGNSTTPARVRFEWLDNQIENRWLQIQVLPSGSTTGFIQVDTYYLGHLQGEVNGQLISGAYLVTNADLKAVLPVGEIVGVGSVRDIDKDRLIRNADVVAVRSQIMVNRALRNITIPAIGTTTSFAMQSLPVGSSTSQAFDSIGPGMATAIPFGQVARPNDDTGRVNTDVKVGNTDNPLLVVATQATPASSIELKSGGKGEVDRRPTVRLGQAVLDVEMRNALDKFFSELENGTHLK